MKEVNYSEFLTLVKKLFSFTPPASMLVKGRAGIGKSSIIKSLEKEGIRVVDIRAINYDVGDLVLKIPNEHSLKNMYAKWLYELSTTNEPTVLLLDEFDKATPAIQRIFYQVILDREVEGLKLSPHVAIVAIENTSEDGSFSEVEREKPLFDRFMFRVVLEPNLQEWTEWALSNSIDRRIIAFLNRFPKNFYIENEEKLIATPRRWEMLSNVIKDVSDLREVEFLTSTVVAPEIATMFKKFIELQEKFDIPAIIQGKKKIPEKLDEQYAIIPGITHYLAKNQTFLKQFLSRVENEFEAECIVLFLRMLITDIAVENNTSRDTVKQKLIQIPEFNNLLKYLVKEVM